MKFNYRIPTNDEFDKLLLTQPNQAFTPRQILEQFARNEVVPSYNQSSDLISDDIMSDDQMLDSDLIEFDDPMEAEQHLIDNQYKSYEEEQSTDSVREGSENGAGETVETT